MFKQSQILLTTAALVIGMYACGGGSSGGSSAPPPPIPPPTAQLPITADNAGDIAADVLDALSSLFDLIELADIAGLQLPDLGTQQHALESMSGLPFGKLTPSLPSHAVMVNIEDCDSGSVTMNWNDADDDLELSSGDSMEMTFSACRFDDLDVTLSGDAAIDNVLIAGDVTNGIPPWSIELGFSFVDLAGTDADGTATINGGFDLATSSTDGLAVWASIAGVQLSVDFDGISQTLNDFSVSETFDLVAATFSIDANGSLTSSEFNGTVNFATPASFVFMDMDENPSSGQLLVSDTESSVLLTVIDNLSVQLDIDSDNDGTTDTTLIVTWDELDID